MKKLLLIPLFALTACGGGSADCQYTTLVQTTYNLNAEAKTLVIGRDTLKGCYATTKDNGIATIKNSEKEFILTIKTNPNSFYVIDDGKEREWTEEHGYKLSNSMSGDTLILKHLPTNTTPDDIIKYGTEYKFYH